jgi:hypothetical protein
LCLPKPFPDEEVMPFCPGKREKCFLNLSEIRMTVKALLKNSFPGPSQIFYVRPKRRIGSYIYQQTLHLIFMFKKVWKTWEEKF